MAASKHMLWRWGSGRLQSLLLPAMAMCCGCMTPPLWEGAGAREVRSGGVAGLLERGGPGGGPALVVAYVRLSGLRDQAFYLTIPVDQDWRAAPGVGVAGLEGTDPRSLSHDRSDEQ